MAAAAAARAALLGLASRAPNRPGRPRAGRRLAGPRPPAAAGAAASGGLAGLGRKLGLFRRPGPESGPAEGPTPAGDVPVDAGMMAAPVDAASNPAPTADGGWTVTEPPLPAPALASSDAPAPVPRRRIALFVEPSPFTYVCGYKNRFLNTIKHLTEAGDEVIVFTTGPTRSCPEPQPDTWNGVRVVALPAFGLPFYPAMPVTLALGGGVLRELRAFRPDLIHCSSPGLMCFAVSYYARKLSLPLVLSYHTNVLEYIPRYVPLIGRLLVRPMTWILRALHAAADLTLVTSAVMAAELTRAAVVSAAAVLVWRRAVDGDIFNPEFGSVAVRRRLLGLAEGSAANDGGGTEAAAGARGRAPVDAAAAAAAAWVRAWRMRTGGEGVVRKPPPAPAAPSKAAAAPSPRGSGSLVASGLSLGRGLLSGRALPFDWRPPPLPPLPPPRVTVCDAPSPGAIPTRTPHPIKTPILLYVGRLGREKNLQSLRAVLAAVPGARLALVGDGPAREELEVWFQGTPTTFLGQLTGAPLSAAYASADVFVMPSETETLGFVVLEAMASGLPVVAARAGGIPDIITREGTTGFLYDPREPAEAAWHVRVLLASEELRERVGKAGRADVERFGWRAATEHLRREQYACALQKHAARGGGPAGARRGAGGGGRGAEADRPRVPPELAELPLLIA